MTTEELKAEAKKLGYKIVKMPEKVKKLGCVCGASSRCVEKWYRSRKYGEPDGIFFKCRRCGRESKCADTEVKAMKKWNELFEKEIKKIY